VLGAGAPKLVHREPAGAHQEAASAAGRFSVDELRRTGAEHVMTDLGDVDRVGALLSG